MCGQDRRALYIKQQPCSLLLHSKPKTSALQRSSHHSFLAKPKPPMATSEDQLEKSLPEYLLRSIHSLTEELNASAYQSYSGDEEMDERSITRREEVRLELDIIRRIQRGNTASLKPNSGLPVDVGGHSVFVRVEEEPRSGYRVWDWQGHLGLSHPVKGYFREITYGHFYEHLTGKETDGGK